MLQAQLQRLGPCTMYTDGGWEYGGGGIDAPFHPYTDSPSHKGGESILFLTTDLRRIQANLNSQEEQSTKDIDHVAIKIDHGEVVGRGPNPTRVTGSTRRTGSQRTVDDTSSYGQMYWSGL